MTAGKLIVFEGIDGSGKSTQVKLFPADSKLAFPRYHTFVGRLIKIVLTKKWASQLNPRAVAFLFGLDRWLAKPMINQWLRAGKTVAIDRYVWSSMAHQGAKLTGKDQDRLIDWIYWLEFNLFQLPRPDKVIYFNLNPEITRQLMKDRQKDLAESDFNYQLATSALYQKLAKKHHFMVINCLDKKGKLKSPGQIHQGVVKYLRYERKTEFNRSVGTKD